MDVHSRIGNWHRWDETFDSSVMQQIYDNWCVMACAEMLTDHRVSQQELSNYVGILRKGADVSDVAVALQSIDAQYAWHGGYIDIPTPASALALLNRMVPWGAVLRIKDGHHMVVIDGVDDESVVLVRDPFNQTRYRIE